MPTGHLYFFLEKCLFRSLAHFVLGYLCFVVELKSIAIKLRSIAIYCLLSFRKPGEELGEEKGYVE